jgi:hypothetical protein
VTREPGRSGPRVWESSFRTARGEEGGMKQLVGRSSRRAAFVACLAAALACPSKPPGPPLPVVASEQGNRSPLVSEVASALATVDPPIGPVEQSRDGLALRNGTLLLSVSERSAGANILHVHIMEANGNFDACVVGGGANRGERTAQVARVFRDIAFPVLWSHVHREALLGARLFTGSEPWGVVGYRGFVGPVMVRGQTQDLSDLDGEALFGGLPALPHDGKGPLPQGYCVARPGRLDQSC